MTKLTKRQVEGLTVKSADYFVWDSEIAGFGVRVMKSGRKSYLVQYRAGGRTRRNSIGPHGVLTADEARNEARRLLGEVSLKAATRQKTDNALYALRRWRRCVIVS